MSYSFNLVDEPWIPCIMSSSGELVHKSMRDTLEFAPSIREVSHASPLVTVALLRLLLAVLHRNFGPESKERWKEIWDRGAWDIATLDSYLEKWHERFNLFDEKHPFYQVGSLDPEKDGVPISKIVMEVSCGNNPTLFDHTTDESGFSLMPSEAACYLIAHQAFDPGGLISRDVGEPPSAKSAPLANAAVILIRGESLFSTLMLNFHRYDPVQGIPFDTHGVDTPAWERNEETEPQDRFPTGHLDYLTWQSRRLRLMTTCDSDGRKVVFKVANLRGNGFPKGFTRHKNETMMAFAKREKALEESDPWPPIVFREGRVLWRDSLAFFQSLNGKRTRPMTLSWLCELVDAGYVPRTATLPLDIFGIRTSKAKPLFWRQERVPLALSYLEDEALLSALTIALEIAEGAGRALRSASRKLAEGIVAPLHDEAIGRPANRDQVSVIESGFGAGRHFWPRLDIPFRKLLVDLAQDRGLMAGGGWEYGTRSLPKWAEVVRTMGLEAFREIIGGLDHLGRTSKAVAIAEIGLQRELRGITSRYVGRGKTLEVAHA